MHRRLMLVQSQNLLHVCYMVNFQLKRHLPYPFAAMRLEPYLK